MKKKIVFMGTPFFASEILTHLVSNNELEIVGVVTQPDKTVGRKKTIVYSAVKETALALNLPIFQPWKVSDFLDDLNQLKPDAIITCAYGQFLPQSILDFHVINIHASLLPRHRGGAPMQFAIMKGDKETGISLMKSVLKMDAGPVYAQCRVSIEQIDTLSSLEMKLIDQAKACLDSYLMEILTGELKAIEQNSAEVTFSPTISSSQELVDFNQPAITVYNHMRALIEQPYAYAVLDKKRVKFTKVKLSDKVFKAVSGTIFFDHQDYFSISLKDGSIDVYEAQFEGKKKQLVKDLYNGYHKQLHGRRFNDEN